MPIVERARWCENVADEIEARFDDLARELTMEQGKPLAESRAEVTSAAAGFRLAAAEVRRLTGQTLPVADPAKRVLTFRRPTGVWAVITPWNFPFNIPIEYLGPALATGNAVVWKPAPSTARIAVRLGECITAAGVPGGLVNLVTGPSLDMARHLSSHPGLVGICFTGSSSVGQQIAQRAAGKKLLLELGRNGPVIVLKDADLPRTVRAVAAAAFANAGQSCGEETFGPIAPVLAADGDDALLAAARSSRLGLSAAIFTRDIPRALRLAERLAVGQVVINDTSNYWELHMPFGGWPGTDSGIGRLGGRHTLEALTEIRSIAIDVTG